MDLTPTTTLEAVNEMLGAIGELPVSDIELTGNTDTAIALRTLHGISREVQSKGWFFNTDAAYTFTLDASNKAPLSAPILSIRPIGRGAQRLAARNNFLFDLSGMTDTFDPESAPTARVIWFYDFELLPEIVRRYITIRAARIFQKNVLGSSELNGYTADHESVALSLLVEEEHEFEFAQGANFINDDPDTSLIGNRT